MTIDPPVDTEAIKAAKASLQPLGARALREWLLRTEPNLHSFIARCAKSAAAEMRRHGDKSEVVAAIEESILRTATIVIESIRLKSLNHDREVPSGEPQTVRRGTRVGHS